MSSLLVVIQSVFCYRNDKHDVAGVHLLFTAMVSVVWCEIAIFDMIDHDELLEGRPVET